MCTKTVDTKEESFSMCSSISLEVMHSELLMSAPCRRMVSIQELFSYAFLFKIIVGFVCLVCCFGSESETTAVVAVLYRTGSSKLTMSNISRAGSCSIYHGG